MNEPSLWRLPEVRLLVALTLLGFTSFFLTLASLPSWAVAGGTSPGSAGLVTAIMMTSTVLVQIAVPALERRMGMARMLAVGLVLLGAPAVLYLLDQRLAWLLWSPRSAVRGRGFAVLTVLGAAVAERVSRATMTAVAGPSIVLLAVTLAGSGLVTFLLFRSSVRMDHWPLVLCSCSGSPVPRAGGVPVSWPTGSAAGCWY